MVLSKDNGGEAPRTLDGLLPDPEEVQLGGVPDPVLSVDFCWPGCPYLGTLVKYELQPDPEENMARVNFFS